MSDHFSGPAVMNDPAVDLTDLFAFPSPHHPENLVLIVDLFPLATPRSLFSDAVAYRFRLRPLTRANAAVTRGAEEYKVEVRFDDGNGGASPQHGVLAASDGDVVRFVVGEAVEQSGRRVFAGLASDPFFMDVEAAARTTASGKFSFEKRGTNTVQLRDVLVIAVELPFAPIVERFHGVTLIGVIAESVVPNLASPLRIERLGRPELKNLILQSTAYDPRTRGVELRDLYNREDAFQLSKEYRPLYESRLDANLAFFDGLDGNVEWPLGKNGQHPLRDLLIDDFLILDLSKPFAAGGFLEIERAIVEGRPHGTCGGRWLDDDIVDELLTLMVNRGQGPRVGDGVDAPTLPGSRSFPYVREPSKRVDLPMPAFLGG